MPGCDKNKILPRWREKCINALSQPTKLNFYGAAHFIVTLKHSRISVREESQLLFGELYQLRAGSTCHK
jgi:hypothetical protein